MSDPIEELMRHSEEEKKAEAESLGINPGLDQWRDSMPEARLPEKGALAIYLEGAQLEDGANNGSFSPTTAQQEKLPLIEEPPKPKPKPNADGTPGEEEPPELTEAEMLANIEGMWQLPANADAENYIEPTTDQMIVTDDWVTNANILWEAFGSPNVHQQRADSHGGPIGYSAAQIMGKPVEEMSQEDIAHWAKDKMSAFNWNLVALADTARRLTSMDDPKASMAFLNIMNMYDHSDGGAKEFGRAIAYLVADPTTYLGLGVGSVASKGIAKTVAKKELSMAVKTMLMSGSAGMVEGAAITGGADLAVQNIEQEADIRKDLDLWRTGKATALGGALGMLLGGSIGYAGGKLVDNFSQAIKREVERQTPRTRTPQDIREMTGQEFRDFIAMQSRIESQMTQDSRGSDVTRLAMRAIIGDDSVPIPRKPDGAIDDEALIKILMDTPVGGDPMETIATALEGVGYKIAREGNSLEFPLAGLDDEAVAIIQRHAEDMDLLAGSGPEGGYQTHRPLLKQVLDMAQDRAETIESMGAPSGTKDDLKVYLRELYDEGDVLDFDEKALEEAIIALDDPNFNVPEGEFLKVQGSPEEMAEFAHRIRTNAPRKGGAEIIPWERVEKLRQKKSAQPDATPVSLEESKKLAQRIIEMDEIKAGELMIAEPGRRGSTVADELGTKYEVVGKTKNGWYRLIDHATGNERNMRRKDFEIFEPPPPTKAGVMELAPFDESAARIIAMSEDISENPLQDVIMTHHSVQKLAEDLKGYGLKIEEKGLFTHWDPVTMVWLRDTYQAQGDAILRLARNLNDKTKQGGHIADNELAFFNNAHTKFVATRDLFHGVSGNAARTLNILRSRPHTDSYDVAAALIDSIGLQGGRVQTERAIKAMAEAGSISGATRVSRDIFGQKVASIIIQARYNMMLSSWRTHVKNVVGNTASGMWEGIVMNPLRFGINNSVHALQLAYSHIPGVKYAPDPASRITMMNVGSEFRGMFMGTSDAFALAMRIARGKELGEGKVWNELGLRYSVMDVPKGMFGKLGTTPVRLLEAGDAFYKHQYFNSKIRGLAEQAANADAIVNRPGANILSREFREYKKKRFNEILDNPDAAMEREAKAYAAKLTYTNDPSIYGGIFAGLAKMAQTAQSYHPFFQALIPFVRTPANLLSYSMEMTGMNVVTSPVKAFQTAMVGTPAERQEMVTRLTAAAGLIMWVRHKWEAGEITGSGPPNFEEQKAMEAAGWASNSISIMGSDFIEVQGIQPAGQALTSIATIFDYMEMNDTERPPTEWLLGLTLTVADQVKDESYLSQLADLVVAIDAKKEGRTQSVAASVASSFLIPNIMRDVRRVTDAEVRTIASAGIIDQIGKAMKNAVPWLSDGLPPRRDWRGRPVNYYGNVYLRAIIPFNMHDREKQDAASMALAYAQIPISAPNRVMSSPGKWATGINLFEMDEGDGYVYDRYVQMVGEARARHVDALISHSNWKKLAADDNIGPGSDGDALLRAAVARGSREGRLRMLDFLIERNTFTRANGNTVIIHHPISKKEYRDLYRDVRKENIPVPDDKAQYDFEERREGPRFFTPDQ